MKLVILEDADSVALAAAKIIAADALWVRTATLPRWCPAMLHSMSPMKTSL
jgi:hypothetical protein